MKQLAKNQLNDSVIVKKAVRAAAVKLGISLVQLAEITGVRREVYSREHESLNRKQMEMCLLVVRIARSLSALVGADETQMRHWVKTENRAFSAAPIEMMKSLQGLVRAVQYLDAMRAKV